MKYGRSIFSDVIAPAPRYLSRLALVQDMLDEIPGPAESFLEIGPGMGDLSQYLLTRFPEANGTLIEFSEEGAKLLRQRFSGNPRISVIELDIRDMPAAATFDLIVACEVLEHIENDTEVLGQIAQRLTATGRFLFSVPAYMSKWHRGDVFAGHFRRYEREEVRRKFADAGMSLDYLWMFGFPICNLLFPIREAYYALRLRSAKLAMQDATKLSGVDRGLARKFAALPMATLLGPFFFLQKLVRNTRLGDGFLVLAKKNPAE